MTIEQIKARIAEMEEEYFNLDLLRKMDEDAVLLGKLSKPEYIERDLQRQAQRRELEAEAMTLLNQLV